MRGETRVTDQIKQAQASDTITTQCVSSSVDAMEAKGKYWSTLKMTPSTAMGQALDKSEAVDTVHRQRQATHPQRSPIHRRGRCELEEKRPKFSGIFREILINSETHFRKHQLHALNGQAQSACLTIVTGPHNSRSDSLVSLIFESSIPSLFQLLIAYIDVGWAVYLK